MIKNLNESINFDEKTMQLFEELEERPEMSCTGAGCGAQNNQCGIQA